MGLLEFNKLPINTLVGADWKTFKDITGGRDIGAAYKGKYRLTKAVCRLLSTLAPLQDRRYEKLLADKPLEHDPVFILGHWRSGTTFVHNVFSCDKHFGVPAPMTGTESISLSSSTAGSSQQLITMASAS